MTEHTEGRNEAVIPTPFGRTWDRMIDLISEGGYKPFPGFVIGPAKWMRALKNASPEDRAILEAMEASRQVIVSPQMPEHEVAYRFQPKTPRSGVTVAGLQDRMTDTIRRNAGGPA